MSAASTEIKWQNLLIESVMWMVVTAMLCGTVYGVWGPEGIPESPADKQLRQIADQIDDLNRAIANQSFSNAGNPERFKIIESLVAQQSRIYEDKRHGIWAELSRARIDDCECRLCKKVSQMMRERVDEEQSIR